MEVPSEIEQDLKFQFCKENIGGVNLSVVDSAIHTCIRRVLSRKGLGIYSYNFVWPVLTVEVLPNTQDAKKFTYDIRQLIPQ